ncbi:zinc finger A20 and AN1 domain-containing stress-associated protein 1-like [Aristolochia californica]|uniref:zinc finger A20 and AN1 domain-containing stress-associated protein 1-like n=1 Tax=Aristolochia californica TaxID=171875 RepID=UPI0035DBC506
MATAESFRSNHVPEARRTTNRTASFTSLDGTHCQTPESVTPCTNGCGVFGSPTTLNLCSVCYRDYNIKQEQAASAKAAVEKSLNVSKNESIVFQTAVPAAPLSAGPTSSSSAAQPSLVAVKNRCFT